MNLRNDMDNFKDDVKKGFNKVGNAAGKITSAVKNTAMDLKDDVVGIMSDVSNKAVDIKDKIEDEMKK